MPDYSDFFDRETIELAEKVAEERGVPVENLLEELYEKMERVEDMRRSPRGKYIVISLDKFDNEDWTHGEYDTAEEAILEARKKTKECIVDGDSSVATVYYAYDPGGNYIGGDIWKEVS